MISAVAEIYKLHPQTLRLYERVGLLKPSRSQGNTRLYTDADLERLDVILTLARDMGVNLAGIEIILNMREKMIEMERQMGEFAHVVQEELSRMAARHEHFMPIALLDSQFATLEEPTPDEDPVIVDVGGKPAEIVHDIVRRLEARQHKTDGPAPRATAGPRADR